MKTKIAACTMALFATAVWFGCGGGGAAGSNPSQNPSPAVTPVLKSIAVSPIGPAVRVKGSVQLKATGTFGDGTTKDLTTSVTWKSNAPSVAQVNGGNVTGEASGVVRISAGSGAVNGSTVVNVTDLDLGNTTLNGQYAFFLKLLDNGAQAYIVGTFSADGNGNITGGIADTNSSAGVSTALPLPAIDNAYSIWPDGRGTASLSIKGHTYSLGLVISQDGSKGKMISLSNDMAYGSFERQDPTVAALSGSYVFAFAGHDSAGDLEAAVGLFRTDGSAGSYDSDIKGTTSTQTLTAALSSISGTRGTATLNASTYAFYAVNATKAFFIETDSVAALAGVAELQTSTGLALANSYTFLLDHAATSHSGTFEKAGWFQLDAAGNIIAGYEDDDHNDVNGPVTSGSLTVDTSGRGQFTNSLLLGTTSAARSGVLYVISANRFAIMNTDKGVGTPGVGVGQLLVDGAVSNAPFTFTATELGENNLLELGQMVFSSTTAGGAAAAGIAYVNLNGAVSALAINGALPSSSGRVEVNPLGGSLTAAMIFYIGSPSQAVLLGVSPDIDGYLDLQ